MKRGAGHFQIEAVVGRCHAVIGGIPVRHQNALEAPIALEHLEVEELVLGGVRAVDQVVGVHHRVHVALGDGGLKGRQVDFAHGALVHFHVHVVPVVLLVVQGIVLDGGDDALRLHALDIGNHQRGVQVGVFGEILEVAASHGRAGDVDAGAEQEIDAAGAGIPAQASPRLRAKSRVPGGGQRHAAGIGGGRPPGAHAHRGVGHFEARQADRRASAWVNMLSTPPSSSIFCSRVSLASRAWALASMAGESGTGAWARACMAAAKKQTSSKSGARRAIPNAKIDSKEGLCEFFMTGKVNAFALALYRVAGPGSGPEISTRELRRG